MMKFLYLGATEENSIIDFFDVKDLSTTFSREIKPTLSPKDPNFPAWWEAHKAERDA